MKLLLVEDSPVIQFVHKAMLNALKCEVDIASSGEEAIAMAKEHDYGLIFLDIELPGINGIETALKISAFKKNHTLRLIALTTQDNKKTIQECLSAGIEQVLRKPIDIKKLESVVFNLSGIKIPRLEQHPANS